MYLNLDLDHTTPRENCEVEVFEFVSEARITGGADFFNGNLILSPLIESPHPSDLHTFQAKAMFSKELPPEPFDSSNATEKAYYHPGGIANELASLLALFFRARIYHVSTTGGDITEQSAQFRTVNSIARKKVQEHWDRPVFRVEGRNFTDFQPFLDKVMQLPEDSHLPIMKAASNYNAALRQIGLDPEMVFVKLVSAIETLSQTFALKPKDDPFANFIDLGNFSRPQQLELASLLKNRKAKRKFVRFSEMHSKGYFKGGNFSAPRLHIMRGDLEKELSRIYDARSAYLHDGESMYLSTPFQQFNWDKDASLGMYVGKRKFSAKKQLPNVQFFEGLVRHCVLNYIDQLYISYHPN